MTRTDIDQRRGAHALDRVKERAKHPKQSDYLSYVKALPAIILQNGLGQAMAALLAAAGGKGCDDPHVLLYEDVQSWLCGADENAPYRNETDLMAAITRHDQARYLRATAETQCYLDWLKKLASAYLRTDSDG